LSRIRLYRTEGIVLRARDFQETDRLLSVLTRRLGKVSAIVKGVKRPHSKLAGGTQPFCYSSLQFAEGRNLDVVTQCVPRDAFYGLRQDLEKMAHASYMAELVDALTEERSPSPRLFDLLLSALAETERTNQPNVVARVFELRLLWLSGYGLELQSCARCGSPVSAETAEVWFSPVLGGVVCPSCRGDASGARRITGGSLAAARALSKAWPDRIPALRLTPAQAAELESCLRASLEYRLERKIRSARFLHEFAPS
jgi:DNA repair protein RecO (recombination protein O)